MRARSMLAAMVVSMGLAIAADASASQELRERKNHFIIDVPDSWKIYDEADYVVAAPNDDSFHLRVAGRSGGMVGVQAAETELMGFLRRHLDNITKDETKAINQNNYVGSEFLGPRVRARRHAGEVVRGDPDRLEEPEQGPGRPRHGHRHRLQAHSGGIHTALGSIRTY